MTRESEPSLYLYRLRMGDHEQTGVAATFSLDEYDSDVVRKHERTRRDKEDDRTRHMVTLGAQTGPVFLTYRGRAASTSSSKEPRAELRSTTSPRRTAWRTPSGASTPTPDGVCPTSSVAVPLLYIADGHHRAASAARAREELRRQADGDGGPCDFFLAVAFPADQLRILPYNRVVRDLERPRRPGSSSARCAEEVAGRAGRAASPPRTRATSAIYLDGRWHGIRICPRVGQRRPIALARRQPSPGAGPRADPRHRGRPHRPAHRLRRRRAAGPRPLEAAVDEGRAAVAFSLHPGRRSKTSCDL